MPASGEAYRPSLDSCACGGRGIPIADVGTVQNMWVRFRIESVFNGVESNF